MLLCFNKGTTKVGLTIYKHRGYTESNNNTVIKLATGADGLIISKF